MWNGGKNTLKEINGTQIESLEELPQEPSNSILISIPYLEYSQTDLEKLQLYLGNGGTLLLMDDYGFGNEVLAYLGVEARFSGKPLLDPLFCYANSNLPKITDFSADIKEQGIDLIVLNHATALSNVPVENILARSSPSSFLDINDNGFQEKNEPALPQPVAARIPKGKGTIILITDPSLLINSMINRYDNLKFIKVILNLSEPSPNVLFDTARLAETPLDAAKNTLGKFRDFLAKPYPSLALVGVVFVTVSLTLLRRGGTVGRQL